ncbi:hypothetical protein D3C71_1298420 [compost metagenome]
MLIPGRAEFIPGHIENILDFRECLQRLIVRQIGGDNLDPGLFKLSSQLFIRETGYADNFLV